MSSSGMADGIRFAGSVLSKGIASSISPSNGCGCVAPSFTGVDSFAGDVFDALIGSLSPCGTSSFPVIFWPWSRCFLLSSSNAMLSDGAVVVGTAVVVGFSIVVVATVVETTVILLLFVGLGVVVSIGRCVGGIQGFAGTIFVLKFSKQQWNLNTFGTNVKCNVFTYTRWYVAVAVATSVVIVIRKRCDLFGTILWC